MGRSAVLHARLSQRAVSDQCRLNQTNAGLNISAVTTTLLAWLDSAYMPVKSSFQFKFNHSDIGKTRRECAHGKVYVQ